MRADQTAYARGQGYAFFSKLLLRGVSAEVLPTVLEVEELALTLDTLPHRRGVLDLIESAAVHQKLFGFNVFPFAGAFLAEDGKIGGEVTQLIEDLWHALGLKWDWRGEHPEHMGLQLQALSGLCHQESQSEPKSIEALFFQSAQRDVLDLLVLPWLAPFVLAVKQEGQPFYQSWAMLIWRWSLEHRASLLMIEDLDPPRMKRPELPLSTIPDAKVLLTTEETGLKEITRVLLQPSLCGCFLSRAALTRLSGSLHLPSGFGSRFDMLESILCSAIDHDKVSELMNSCLQEVESWRRGFELLLQTQPDWSVNFVKPWRDRLKNTTQILRTLKEGSTQ